MLRRSHSGEPVIVMRRLLGGLGLGFLVSACTVVKVHNAEVRHQLYPGLLQLQVLPAADGVSLVRTQGLGLSLGPRSTSLGWTDELHWLSRDPTACRVLIVVRTAQEAQALMKQAPFRDGAKDLCVIETQGERK
jgi:hypothetical protein